MSLGYAVEQAIQVLADTYAGFGPNPQTPVLAAPAPPDAPAPDWSGEGAETHTQITQAQRTVLDGVNATDQRANTAAADTAQAAADGRAGMGRIITAAQSDVTALAPVANTPNGQVELAETLRRHLLHTKALILAAKRRNHMLAARMSGAQYPSMGGAMGTPGMGGAMGEPFTPGRRVHHGRLASRAIQTAARQSGFSSGDAHAIAADAVNLSPNATKDQMRAYAASQLSKHGWGQGEMLPLDALEDHEASWNPKAHNPSGASGMGQMMPYTKPFYDYGNENQPWWRQIDAMLDYISQRYGSPSAAWAQYYNHAGGEGSY